MIYMILFYFSCVVIGAVPAFLHMSVYLYILTALNKFEKYPYFRLNTRGGGDRIKDDFNKLV